MRSSEYPQVVRKTPCHHRWLLIIGLVSAAVLSTSCSSGGSAGEPSGLDVPLNEVVGTEVPASEQRIILNDNVRPYITTGQYSDVLKECIVPEGDPCTLQTLPFIGQEYTSPTVDNIMERLLVSHDWMGLRFEQLLKAMPAETLPLFKSVTAIMIGSDIRPSNYWVKYGRIQLDPRNLWLSNSEKVTVTQKADFREDFGSTLLIDGYSRIVKNGNYAWGYYSLTGTDERTLEDILLPMSNLLFHELAHANDYVSRDMLPTIPLSTTPLDAFLDNVDTIVSERLYNEVVGLSDNNSLLFPLARVRFQDEESDDVLNSITGAEAGAIMATEGKASFYGYSNSREDAATLFAHSMMRRHFGVETHVAFIDLPEIQEDAPCTDYTIGWGVTNRVGAPLVANRAKWVTEQILGPSAAIDNFFSNTGSEGMLPTGVAWCESLNILLASRASLNTGPTMADVRALEQELFAPHNW